MPCIFPHIRFLALENSTLTFLLEFTTKLALSFAYIRVVFVQVQKGVKFRNLKYYCTKSNFWWWMQLQKNQFPLSIAQHALQISNVCSHRYFNFPRIPRKSLQTFFLIFQIFPEIWEKAGKSAIFGSFFTCEKSNHGLGTQMMIK